MVAPDYTTSALAPYPAAPHADVTKVAHDFLRTEFFKAQTKY